MEAPSRPWVTILTPVYNGWEFLEECACSVYYQALSSAAARVAEPVTWEWWIGVNGHGPTGGPALAAAERVKDMLDRNTHGWPGRTVHVVNLPHVRGKVAALNALVTRARGEWVAILDCDDTWDSQKLLAQKVATEMVGPDTAAIGTFCWYFGDIVSAGPDLPPGWIRPESWHTGNPLINSSAIVRREHARWEDRFGLEDYDLWIRLLRGGFKIYNIAQRLTHHRIHKGSAFNGKGGQDVAGLLAYHSALEEALKGCAEKS